MIHTFAPAAVPRTLLAMAVKLHPAMEKAELDRFLADGFGVVSNPYTAYELFNMSRPAMATATEPQSLCVAPEQVGRCIGGG